MQKTAIVFDPANSESRNLVKDLEGCQFLEMGKDLKLPHSGNVCRMQLENSIFISNTLMNAQFSRVIFVGNPKIAFASTQRELCGVGNVSNYYLPVLDESTQLPVEPDSPLNWEERFLAGKAYQFFKQRNRVVQPAGLQDWVSRSADSLPFHIVSIPIGISVCIATRNRVQQLERQLDSLLAQSQKPDEILVYNDDSDVPGYAEEWNRLKEKYASANIQWFTGRRRGAAGARNFLATWAVYPYLLFCDDDNVSYPHMIAEFKRTILFTGADIVSCGFDFFTDDQSEIRNADYYPMGPSLEVGMVHNIFGDTNSVFRAEAFRKVGGFKTDAGKITEDWELFYRMVSKGFQLQPLLNKLFKYNVVARSNTGELDHEKSNERRLMLIAEDSGIPFGLLKASFDHSSFVLAGGK